MQKKVDSKTKNYTNFVSALVPILEKFKVKDILILVHIDGQIRNTYLPCTGVEDPLYCEISDGLHSWLQSIGHTKDPGSSKMQHVIVDGLPDELIPKEERGIESVHYIIDVFGEHARDCFTVDPIEDPEKAKTIAGYWIKQPGIERLSCFKVIPGQITMQLMFKMDRSSTK